MEDKQGNFYHIPAFRCDVRCDYGGHVATEHSLLVIGSFRGGLEKPLPLGEDCILKILGSDTLKNTIVNNSSETPRSLKVVSTP
jgi:hypothetical protein